MFAFTKITDNLKSGITVSLISIPVSISLAVASGANPFMGIITAIWAGLTASFFASSNYTIIGTTSSLSGILALYAMQFGACNISLIAIIAGVFIVLAYILRLERFLIFIPSSVIHGTTLGLALIIILNQINFALGLTLPRNPEIISNFINSIKNYADISYVSLIMFLIFFSILKIARKFIPKLPGTILVSPIGIIIGYLHSIKLFSFDLTTLGSRFGHLHPKLFNLPTLCFKIDLIIPALIVAFIAILETIVSAKIADGMTGTKHNPNKEIFGLGIANIVCGIMGGIPAAATIARTSANIRTGATDKISATISSLFIILWAFCFVTYFEYMPMPIIAAILINGAVNLIKHERFERLWIHDKTNFFISIIVAFFTIYKNPIVGVLLGATLSLLLLVQKLSHGYHEIVNLDEINEPISDEKIIKTGSIIYYIKGKLTYINSQAHIIHFETTLTKYKSITLSFRDTYFIDIDGADAFDDIIDIALKNHQLLKVIDLNAEIKNFLRSTSENFKYLQDKNLIS